MITKHPDLDGAAFQLLLDGTFHGIGGAHAAAVMLGQREDSQAFGHVLFQPFSEFRCGVAISGDQLCQGCFDLCQRTGVPDGAQLGADAFADRDVRCVMDRVLGQVELAPSPFRCSEDDEPLCAIGSSTMANASRARSGMIVRDDLFHPAQTTGLKALQESPPVNLGLRQRNRDPEYPAAFVRADPDG